MKKRNPPAQKHSLSNVKFKADDQWLVQAIAFMDRNPDAKLIMKKK